MAAILRAVLAPLFEVLVQALFSRLDRPAIKSVEDGPARLPGIVEVDNGDLVRRGRSFLR